MPRNTTIHILRHGTRQDFITAEWTSPTGLPKDPPLADVGHAQAEEVAAHLHPIPVSQQPQQQQQQHHHHHHHSNSRPNGVQGNIRFTHVFTSPFTRCLQTAEPLARRAQIQLKVEPGLGEWFNDWDTDRSAPPPCPRAPTVSELDALFPGLIDTLYTPQWRQGTQWESKDEIHERVHFVLERLLAYVENDIQSKGTPGAQEEDVHVLIVTHAACQIALGRALLRDRFAVIRCGVASFCRFRKREGEDGWTMEANGDAAHLKGGLMYNWAFTE
ncbi:hypothetical protein PhCBS80983_g05490 [Powellomyces hirtus]|uniref:Phosphoglycerate mutase-like protein n=1 Tax=Powellomyces hirtus TaxID=109895 RepID=A0A507DU21_9FUNG|nr:hypothetical protein PhCBS80983_g05490 [Powellomyces hirtus]